MESASVIFFVFLFGMNEMVLHRRAAWNSIFLDSLISFRLRNSSEMTVCLKCSGCSAHSTTCIIPLSPALLPAVGFCTTSVFEMVAWLGFGYACVHLKCIKSVGRSGRTLQSWPTESPIHTRGDSCVFLRCVGNALAGDVQAVVLFGETEPQEWRELRFVHKAMKTRSGISAAYEKYFLQNEA